jgi:hypothetical protein
VRGVTEMDFVEIQEAHTFREKTIADPVNHRRGDSE